jgi:hypothetical protein
MMNLRDRLSVNRVPIEPVCELGFGFCSAHLQVGIGLCPKCPHEGGRYRITLFRVLNQTAPLQRQHVKIAELEVVTQLGTGWSKRLPAQKTGGLYNTCHQKIMEVL